MKSTTGINQQISKVQSAIMALKATNTDVQSITIRGNKPVICSGQVILATVLQ
ncbi:hypothetical protein [Escherichia coli]|uniref:hypothetical protein n=1 Tax=Escherichia coli TaxID=562 RepID=UPI0021C7BFC6|nr:hypothetical protein [Escherichia coli]